MLLQAEQSTILSRDLIIAASGVTLRKLTTRLVVSCFTLSQWHIVKPVKQGYELNGTSPKCQSFKSVFIPLNFFSVRVGLNGGKAVWNQKWCLHFAAGCPYFTGFSFN